MNHLAHLFYLAMNNYLQELNKLLHFTKFLVKSAVVHRHCEHRRSTEKLPLVFQILDSLQNRAIYMYCDRRKTLSINYEVILAKVPSEYYDKLPNNQD